MGEGEKGGIFSLLFFFFCPLFFHPLFLSFNFPFICSFLLLFFVSLLSSGPLLLSSRDVRSWPRLSVPFFFPLLFSSLFFCVLSFFIPSFLFIYW